ncbi:MAG: hypothetical protein QF790_06565 [Gammaproteobacteria bacterium]|jgi:hypothetical protein|nr:hypothetical protein [Gammaproteobacteria bacterium]MDP6616810.1 hypothetical protein [Gammaproteobacteria bacterium]MDP6695241.1 hypothetical protein [Gammaproteobacteria bacterium]
MLRGHNIFSIIGVVLKHPWIVIVLVPCSVNLLLVGMYFSGVPLLANIVAPYMPDVAQMREFGLLENLENIYLLTMAAMGVAAIRLKTLQLEKAAAVLYTLFAIFLFLEEVDYGLHWIEFLRGTPPEEQLVIRNLHNQDSGFIDTIIKEGMAYVTLIWFVIAPFALQRSKNRWVRYLLPAKQYAIAFLLIVLISRLAHYLDDQGRGNTSLLRNISEFREHGMFYLYMIWSYTLIYRRSLGSGT